MSNLNVKNQCMVVRGVGRLNFVCGNPSSTLCGYRREDVQWTLPNDVEPIGTSCAYGFDSNCGYLCVHPDAQNEAVAEFLGMLREVGLKNEKTR